MFRISPAYESLRERDALQQTRRAGRIHAARLRREHHCQHQRDGGLVSAFR
jgi:hypothetical protein